MYQRRRAYRTPAVVVPASGGVRPAALDIRARTDHGAGAVRWTRSPRRVLGVRRPPGQGRRGIGRAHPREHLPGLLRTRPGGPTRADAGLAVIYTTTVVAKVRFIARLAWPVALRGVCVLAPVSRFAAFRGTNRARGASHHVAEPPNHRGGPAVIRSSGSGITRAPGGYEYRYPSVTQSPPNL
jgi:hypothetical protein